MKNGFTLIEILVAMFFLAIAVIAIVGVSVLSTRSSLRVEKKVVAQAMVNDAIEGLHALSYDRVGIVPTGAILQANPALPYGSVEYAQEVVKNQQTYSVITSIIPIDDPENGTVSGILDFTTADYKSIRVEVRPKLGGTSNGSPIVSAVTTIANWPPAACTPGDPTACSTGLSDTPPSFTFETKEQIRTFINSLGIYTSIPENVPIQEGLLYYDTATKNKICDLKGYTSVGTDTSGTHTIGSRYFDTKWNSATNNFETNLSGSGSSIHIEKLTCTSPKPVASCSYPVACPASGRCSDAYLKRGFNPAGVQYQSTCKSSADCSAGYTCNSGSGICEVASPQKYQFATSEDPQVSGTASDCTKKYPPGGGWEFRSRQTLLCANGICNRDVCLWRKPVTGDRQYYFKRGPGTSTCSATDSAVSGSTLISSGCANPSTACPAYDGSTGKTTKADYCFYEKVASPAAMDLTLRSVEQQGVISETNSANCATFNPFGGAISAENINATITIDEVYNTNSGDTLPNSYFGNGDVRASGEEFPLIVGGNAITDPVLPGEVPGISVQRFKGFLFISINSDSTSGAEGARGTITIEGSTFTSMLTGTTIEGLENTSGHPAQLGNISRDEAIITSPTQLKFTFTAGPDRDGFLLFYPVYPSAPPVINPSRVCVSDGPTRSSCKSDLCLWRNTNQCLLPATTCTRIEYDASKGTLPEDQGWTKNVTPATLGLSASTSVSTDAASGKKFIRLVDYSASGYIDYSYAALNPSAIMDQDWTYEITMRPQEANPGPLAVGPIQFIVADGLKYLGAVVESTKIGALGTSSSPYSYAASSSNTPSGFVDYKITYRKYGAGVTDDAYDISINGASPSSLVGIGRGASYAPGSGDFSQGLLFGFGFAPSQGVVDVSKVVFTSGSCV